MSFEDNLETQLLLEDALRKCSQTDDDGFVFVEFLPVLGLWHVTV